MRACRSRHVFLRREVYTSQSDLHSGQQYGVGCPPGTYPVGGHVCSAGPHRGKFAAQVLVEEVLYYIIIRKASVLDNIVQYYCADTLFTTFCIGLRATVV